MATHPQVDLNTNETMHQHHTHTSPKKIFTQTNLNVDFDVGGMTPDQCDLFGRDQGVHMLGDLRLRKDAGVGRIENNSDTTNQTIGCVCAWSLITHMMCIH